MPENSPAMPDEAETDGSGPEGTAGTTSGSGACCPSHPLDLGHIIGFRWLRREADSLLGDGVCSELMARSASRKAEIDLRSTNGEGLGPTTRVSLESVIGAFEDKGYGEFVISEHDWKEGWLLIEARGTFESRMTLASGGPTEYPACDILRGLLLGSYRFLRKQASKPAEDLTAIEVACEARGDDACRFAVGTPEILRAHGVKPVSMDLTSRVKLEEMLRNSREGEAGLRKLVEDMPFGVARFDIEGRVTFANRKILDMLSMPRHAVIGKQFIEFIHPDDREHVNEGFARVVGGRADPYPVPCRLVDSDGNAHASAVDAFPIQDENGEVVGYQGIALDLEDRERLGLPSLRFRESLRASSRAYMEIGTDGHIVHINAAAINLLGDGTDDEIVGTPFSRMVPGEKCAAALRAFMEVAAGRSGYETCECMVGTVTTRRVRLEFIAYGLVTGRVERVLAIAEDAPDRDELIAALTAKDEQLRLLMEQDVTGIAIIQDGAVKFVNRAATAISGFSLSEAASWGEGGFVVAIHPDDRAFVMEQFEKRRAGDRDVADRYTFRMFAKSGESRWIDARVRQVDYHGQPASLVMFADVTDLKQAESRLTARGDDLEELVKERTADFAAANEKLEKEIAERKQAEEALRFSEERLRAVFDSAFDGIVIVERDSMLLRAANQAFCRMLGYDKKEIAGLRVEDIHPEDEVPRAREEIAAQLRRESTATKEIRVKRKDGSVFYADTSASPMTIDDDVYLVGVFRDVTERRAADKNLREAEGRFRSLFYNSVEMVYIHDLEGRFIEANDAARDLLGYGEDEIQKLSFGDLLDERDLPRAIEATRRLMENGTDRRHEYRLRAKDGSEAHVEVTGVSLHKDGAPYAILGIARDITEHKRMLDALRKSEDWFRSLIENADTVYAVVDAQGQTLYESPSLERVYGWKPEEIVGKSIFDLVHPDDIEAATNGFADLMRSPGKPISMDIRYRHKDGSWRDIEVTGVNLLENDAIRGVVLTSHDTTERKRAAAALEASEARYHTLFDAAPVGIGVADMDGNVYATNLRMQEMMGYEPEEIVKVNVVDTYVDNSDRGRIIDQLRRDKRVRDFSTRLRRKDGVVFDAMIGADIIEVDGKRLLLTTIRDVTVSRRAQEALRESEERFKTFAEMLPEIVYEADERGKLVFVNKRAHEATGYSKADIDAGLEISALLAPEDRERAMADVEQILGGGRVSLGEYTACRKDDSTFPVLVRSERIVRDGVTTGIRGIAVDISERKATETTLRESEAKYRGIFENLHDTYFRTDLDGTIQMASPSGEHIFGYTVDEVIGKNLGDFYLDPHDRAEVRRLLQEQGFLREFEAPLKRKDGSVIWVSSNCGLRIDEEGRPFGVEGITRDITQRKRAERVLRESEELHRTLIDALPNAVTMTDLDGNMTYVSRRAMELQGVTKAEDLLGQAVSDLVVPEDRKRTSAVLMGALKSGNVGRVECSILRRDGSIFPGDLSVSVVTDANGKPKGFVGISRDLTERKRAEEELRKAEGRREELAVEVAALRSELQGRYGPDSIIGQDPKMRAIYDTILAVGPTNATVLVQGETGTGKELVAKAVHYNSTRADEAFVKVDCGALAETLLESELFGHVKGAYTGAVRDRAGRFEFAHEGTVFLDEVQNLSMPLQAKLLRVVQEGRFEKVGGTETVEVDVRIVAATNENLERLVAKREFRKDLYYRLKVIPILLPPLAERRGDIPLLARSFIERFAQRHDKTVGDVSQGALDKLMGYDWPGNVRELENIVEQAVVFSRGRTLEANEIRLPDLAEDRGSGFWAAATSRPLRKALEAPEKKILQDALARTNGNKKEAAKLLGISRSAFYEKLKRHGLSTKRGGSK